ncbi:hypothetical protein [Streptomyces hebeiensis]
MLDRSAASAGVRGWGTMSSGSSRFSMSSRHVPYGLTFDQNSAVRPRRSSGVTFLGHVDVDERGLEQVRREHRRVGSV